MTLPLVFLALGSAFTGFIPFGSFVSSDQRPFETEMHLGIVIPSVLIAVTGIFIAYVLYRKENVAVAIITKKLGAFYNIVYNKFYIDEVYLFVTKRILFNLVSRPVAWFDRHIVDGTMNGIARIIGYSSEKIKGLQSGQLHHYALAFVSGAIILVLIALYKFS
jgi:NADH-quinone oxidoreductase subunit L